MPKIIKDGRIYGAAPSTLADLSDTTVSSPTNNQVLKYDASTQKWVNGVGSAVISCSQTEYDAWKTAGTLKDETMYVITDAPNLNATAQDISYDGGADTVWDKVESLKDTTLKVATFTASVTTATSGGQQVGEITVANMTGYDATIWSKMKAYSIFGSYANDGRFGIIPVIRSSNTILSFIALAGGTYSVTMFVFYSDT